MAKKKSKKKLAKKQHEEKVAHVEALLKIPLGDFNMILHEFGFGLGIGPIRSPMTGPEDREEEKKSSIEQKIGFQPNEL